ncbi:hypothetical protein ACE1TF_03930 [Geomicrobium sp. JSM 1781026]|uniref:hypothetical protein n=1 Tax=Geomicrobium sp. JSM 1781026 TaxID=3344580 RepID=UPI0035C04E3C
MIPTRYELLVIGDGTEQKIPDRLHTLRKQVRKSFKVKMATDELEQFMKRKQKVFYPIWVVKLQVIAERKPFSPKITAMTAFIDAISGHHQLHTDAPSFEYIGAIGVKIPPKLSSVKQIEPYIANIKTHLNKKYMNKKPDYLIEDSFLSYMPLWEYEVKYRGLTKTFALNATTGEPEQHLLNGRMTR